MKNKFKIDGLWIPYQILTDKNLRDKEKIIYSLILFFSNKKGYTLNKYIYKNNHKEILYRQISSIRKNDDTYRLKVQYRYNKKVQQGMDKNDKVLKSKKNNYKKYNNIRNYEGRNYPPEYLETLYANKF